MESLDSEFAYLPKRTPAEWLRTPEFEGVEVLDWDGWRKPGSPARHEPITLEEFRSRLAYCTTRRPTPDEARELDERLLERLDLAELAGGDVLNARQIDPARAKTVFQLDNAGSVFVPDEIAALPDGSITIDPALDMAEVDEDTHTCAEQAKHRDTGTFAWLGMRPYVLLEYSIEGGDRMVDVRFGGGITCKHQARWALVEALHVMSHDPGLGPLDETTLAFLTYPCKDD